ncbi:FAD-dependent tricarballylate dehydrogenase TcuA [Halospina sp. K52047b]|uniref:FAD-dependent tricarballylate dehydrogenase TcuA n=1 Tax=Halospina sp. K52047b TaxID=2614160 RepID=UPI001249E3C5|nr:FAD-dependent tricarballylate dehydrogenase TcuA [Halospina sp. K52047b]KAA8977790.1 FAD-dependent tricarballylate dehydrogenase TcuA [Halospina sp. K52047b]
MNTWTVLVIGSGMAGLCAALEARLYGADVALVDAAPPERFGGNARHARNFRVVHDHPLPWVPDRYPAAELAEELAGVGGMAAGPVFEQWALQSGPLVEWLAGQGVRYQHPDSSNRRYSRRTAFLLGGGQAMVGVLRGRLEALQVPVRTSTRVIAMPRHTGPGQPVCLEGPEGQQWVHPGAVVAAAGGCQWNQDWLAQAYPQAGGGILCRGTPENRGELLTTLHNRGALSSGRPDTGHMVVVDARGPAVDGGIVTRLDRLDLGLVVDAEGRCLDPDVAPSSPSRYAVWGQCIAQCRNGRAWLLLDEAGRTRMPPTLYKPLRVASVTELALHTGLPENRLRQALEQRFNGVPQPLHLYPLAAGVTFAAHGVAVDADARVRLPEEPGQGLFAAGTLMAPTLLGTGYLAGAGLSIAGVFGRIAGASAARHVQNASVVESV